MADSQVIDIELGAPLTAGESPPLTQKQTDELRKSLLQPVCEGACFFNSSCTLCCLAGIIMPIICFSLMADFVPEAEALLIAGCIGVAVGLIMMCSLVWHLLLPKPPVPEAMFPLSKPSRVEVPKKVYVLVNPKGGTKSAQATYENIVKPKLAAAGVEHVKIETEYAGHGKDLCNTLPLSSEGFDAVVAIGGDGTFHECVNGLLDRKDGEKCAIGLIPGGSGNSFLTDFGLQNNAQATVDNIVAGRIADIDATRVVFGPDDAAHHLWSINVVGYCADHCMGACNIDEYRGCLGTARYDVCALWGLLKGRTTNASVKVDGKDWISGVGALFVNTTQHFGKGMRAAPNAQVDDGLCDIGSIKGSRGHSLRQFTLVKTGQHAALADSVQGKNVELVLPEPQGVFNVDGEVTIHHHNSIKLTVHQGAFQFYVPVGVQVGKM